MKELQAIDLGTLARVAGGQNTDLTESKLSLPRVRGVPIPVRTTTTKSTRSELGQCIDDSKAACERTGGSNEAVGTCMLNGIDACAKR